MSWCDRRAVLLGGAAALAGCGFTPVYGPQGAGGRLAGQIALAEPDTPRAYLFARRFEDRMGRAGPSAAFLLRPGLSVRSDGLGTTSTGSTTRFRLTGTANYALFRAGEEEPALDGRTTAFTGYSTTGSTVATQAARRDAEARLMTILADQVIDALLLSAERLPA